MVQITITQERWVQPRPYVDSEQRYTIQLSEPLLQDSVEAQQHYILGLIKAASGLNFDEKTTWPPPYVHKVKQVDALTWTALVILPSD
ncbi:hypothetical protein KSD_02130 [Ktedonobacter sp. SOSP1-85]|uniref:hypothetical protein n=1 Tax=Ktedonobacter sp. SOSP1-85 TaxID=2778367 RepID=UPI001916C824|nr:hypothetical protein [Ktedonobacter sp. SOSP1-85]GHO72442.1 hypothetical protein KSD_02130 [Ktedonobacter sp. SOSP1-85]